MALLPALLLLLLFNSTGFGRLRLLLLLLLLLFVLLLEVNPLLNLLVVVVYGILLGKLGARLFFPAFLIVGYVWGKRGF